MKTTILVFISLVFALCYAASVTTAGSKHHMSKWTLTSQSPKPQEEVVLGFAIKQRNLDKLDALFWSVSDPSSHNYGKYLSSEELAELVGSEEEAIASIKRWLEENGAKSVRTSATKDYIWATFTHSKVESLLDIELGVYVHNDFNVDRQALITRSESTPSVPSELAPHIDFISGVWHFPATEAIFKDTNPANRIAARAVDPVSPDILEVEGIPEGIKIYFLPVCSKGNVSEVIVDPCSDYDNAITNYTVVTTQFDYTQNRVVTQTFNIGPSSAWYPNCTIVESIFGDTLYCYFAVYNLVNDAYVNATMSYCFEDGTCTETVDVSGGSLIPVVPSVYHNPNDVRTFYGVPTAAVGTNQSNSQAVAAFILQFFSPDDLALFFAEFDLPPYTVQKIVGPNNPPFPGDEASLDIQYIMGIGQGVNSWFWSMGGSAWIAEWAQAVLNTPNAPWVHSISYGESESDVTPTYINRTEVELQKLGVSGRSVMVSSGDDGTGDQCDQPYDVSWPASSPHVTSVGATRITRGATPDCQSNPGGQDCNVIGEVSASYDLGLFWTTGGGFSTVFNAPSYQQSAIDAYFNTAPLPDQSLWTKTGRGYPDVSAVGHYLLVVDGGEVEAIDGTSASSPIFAGMISLLNEARIQAGKAPLGFLNPWLYSLPAANSTAFYDVTVGDTTFCSSQDPSDCCATSFVAAKGWDAASGLGTPNFPVLLKQALTLP